LEANETIYRKLLKALNGNKRDHEMSVITKETERKYWERFEKEDYPTIEEMREQLIPFDKEVRLYLLRKRGNQLVEITKGENKPTQEQRF